MSTQLVALRAPFLSRPKVTTGRSENRLLVVGDESLRALVAAEARRGGHTMVAHVEPQRVAGANHLGWDDLVIDAGSLDELDEQGRELLRRARRVWPVRPGPHVGQTDSALFAHPLPPGGRVAKRSVDILLSLVGLVLALPVLLVAMAAVRCETPGPSLFKQVRVGANGRRFRFYKLRTMHDGNDDSAHRAYVAQLISGTGERCGALFKLIDDPRITRVGRFLRNFSIDELPQLWNVLKGDMSLVGPRPPLPSEVELYSAEAWERLRVKPGLTGLWQVSGRCKLSFAEMVSLDVRYWQRWSLRSDAAILLRTPKTVLAGRGAA